MRQAILELLKKHQEIFISGEEISKRFGISRTAVWKHINRLKEEGYDIESVTKLGYKLKEIPDTLLPEEIKSRLKTKVIGQEIHYFPEIVSTNSYCKTLGDKGVSEGAAVIAESQQNGRRRFGRTWISPPQKGLYFSLLLRPKISPQEASRLIFLTAVTVACVLDTHFNLKAGIKWPNDLILNGKKFAGILLEMKAEAEQVDYLVLGVGINVNNKPEEFPGDLAKTATSLFIEKGLTLSRVELLTTILNTLEKAYFNYLNNGFGRVLELWKKYNITLGKRVTVTNWQTNWSGLAKDINPYGGLILVLPDGTEKTMYSGDVTLKV